MYKIIRDSNINEEIIFRTKDNTYIPTDLANRHYQEYLAWVAEGNTPEEAD